MYVSRVMIVASSAKATSLIVSEPAATAPRTAVSAKLTTSAIRKTTTRVPNTRHQLSRVSFQERPIDRNGLARSKITAGNAMHSLIDSQMPGRTSRTKPGIVISDDQDVGDHQRDEAAERVRQRVGPVGALTEIRRADRLEARGDGKRGAGALEDQADEEARQRRPGLRGRSVVRRRSGRSRP